MPLRKIRHTRASVVERIDAEYRALDRVVRRLTETGLRRPVPGFGARARIPRERWTGKDALAHVVEWKRQALRALRAEPSDPELRGLPFAEQNRVLYERWRGRPARAVVDYHRSVHREIRAALRALPDAYFEARRSPHWPSDLVGHAADHRQRHLEVLLPTARPTRSTRSVRAATSGR